MSLEDHMPCASQSKFAREQIEKQLEMKAGPRVEQLGPAIFKEQPSA